MCKTSQTTEYIWDFQLVIINILITVNVILFTSVYLYSITISTANNVGFIITFVIPHVTDC